jgi:cyclophilin family peptidyl-prolyl cis-trans isomerase
MLTFLLTGCGSGGGSASPTPKATAHLSFSAPPKMSINTKKTYLATVRTSDGPFVIDLNPAVAPLAVNNFVFLARHHFYNRNIFHRIIKGQFIQSGDPTGTGFGGPGYTFKIEKPPAPYAVGDVAMANTGQANSNGSQFFIIAGPAGTRLKPNYTVIGKVRSGMNVVEKIAATAVGTNPGNNELSDPLQDVFIDSISIH